MMHGHLSIRSALEFFMLFPWNPDLYPPQEDHERGARTRPQHNPPGHQHINSVGMIPTGVGLRMIIERDAALGFALLVEAVYVRLYNGRDLEASRLRFREYGLRGSFCL
jgi:hypothetical protein